MRPFLDQDFLLQTNTAKALYHQHAAKMPIIDYHNHLSPEQIANDHQFDNLTAIWLHGDHYKWRAMRTNGINERFCTGNATDEEKFEQWAATVPYTMRNPLYHWTHLELQRYFGITDLLSPDTAKNIYAEATAMLRTPAYSVQNLLRKMNVEVVCTTDDPIDSLEYHIQIQERGLDFKVLPAFRPDKAMAVENTEVFNQYVNRLGQVSKTEIRNLEDFLVALYKRHDFFALIGCKLSDHGLEKIESEDYTKADIEATFLKIRYQNTPLTAFEVRQFKAAMLEHLAKMDWEKGWTQQFHLGALRNNNARMMKELGPDTGWDSMGDFEQGRTLSRFLSNLDSQNQLAKTILYNLNPADNELFATMIGNFNDGSVAGKVQWGSGWWFLDQKDGMERQLNALSNMGLLSRFLGMLTDSRSFLSFPRHEYFRRILCNLLGNDVENGELPADMPWIGKMVENICYNNAKEYFGF